MDGMQQWPAEAIQLIKQLQQEIEDMKKRISQLENKIKVYENPHTPSSMQRFKGRTSGTNPPGKRGAPPGHYGATRSVPEPDEIIPVTMDQCPRCGSYLGNSIGIESRTIEDLPPPQKIQVTQYDLHKYVCPGCGCEITARHQDCPMVGNLGIRLMTQIAMTKFHQRGVLRRIQEGLQGQNGFQISPKGIHDVLLRVGDACIPEHDLLKQRIWQALWKHADETVMPVIGKHWWL